VVALTTNLLEEGALNVERMTFDLNMVVCGRGGWIISDSCREEKKRSEKKERKKGKKKRKNKKKMKTVGG
jgi:hypothetical protein